MYDILIPELRDERYSTMSPDQILTDLFTPRISTTIMKFGSFRSMASYLTEAEYNVIKKVITAFATQSELMADMKKMLETPGGEDGEGGGLDHGDASFRARVTALPDAAKGAGIINDEEYALANSAKDKILGFAVKLISKAESLGITDVAIGNIICAKERMGV
jgi:hypothetical protein